MGEYSYAILYRQPSTRPFIILHGDSDDELLEEEFGEWKMYIDESNPNPEVEGTYMD